MKDLKTRPKKNTKLDIIVLLLSVVMLTFAMYFWDTSPNSNSAWITSFIGAVLALTWIVVSVFFSSATMGKVIGLGIAAIFLLTVPPSIYYESTKGCEGYCAIGGVTYFMIFGVVYLVAIGILGGIRKLVKRK